MQKLSDEIETADQTPQDLKERLIAIRPEFAPMWPSIESEIKQYLTDHPRLGRLADELNPEERSAGLALATIAVAKVFCR